MPAPVFAPTWLDTADVRKWLKDHAQPPANDDVELGRVCAETEIHVQRVRPDGWTFPEPPERGPATYVPDAEIYQGAVMYAARALRRKNTPGGVEFTEAGAVFSPRYDPQIDEALHTGAWTRPGVG
jgi:hypothetical protein